jgi:hypothetical protein
VPTARTIVKNSILGFAVVVVALFLFISFVPGRYWPKPPCTWSELREVASPSKAMVARYVRSNCNSKRELEAIVLIGYPDNPMSGTFVFSAPASYPDRSGVEQTVDLRVVWRAEDTLEIYHPDKVAPNKAARVFHGSRLIVSVTAIPEK